jgi:hypothetical protein
MPQDCPEYSQADATKLIEEEAKFQERKRVKEILSLQTHEACTCGSPFGMDVDRCPVHGEGCA